MDSRGLMEIGMLVMIWTIWIMVSICTEPDGFAIIPNQVKCLCLLFCWSHTKSLHLSGSNSFSENGCPPIPPPVRLAILSVVPSAALWPEGTSAAGLKRIGAANSRTGGQGLCGYPQKQTAFWGEGRGISLLSKDLILWWFLRQRDIMI